MTSHEDLVTLLRAGTPLIVIDSAEEPRVLESFRHAISQVLRPLYRWSITEGLRRLDMGRSGARRNRHYRPRSVRGQRQERQLESRRSGSIRASSA